MVKRLIYAGQFKGPLLMEQLLAAHPEWLVGDRESRRCLLRVETTDAEARITVPDDVSDADIAAVITMHDPAAPSAVEAAASCRAEIDAKAEEARSLWDAYEALKDKTPQEIEVIVRKRVEGWTSLAAAKADLAEWLPRMAALLAWAVRHQ